MIFSSGKQFTECATNYTELRKEEQDEIRTGFLNVQYDNVAFTSVFLRIMREGIIPKKRDLLQMFPLQF